MNRNWFEYAVSRIYKKYLQLSISSVQFCSSRGYLRRSIIHAAVVVILENKYILMHIYFVLIATQLKDERHFASFYVLSFSYIGKRLICIQENYPPFMPDWRTRLMHFSFVHNGAQFCSDLASYFQGIKPLKTRKRKNRRIPHQECNQSWMALANSSLDSHSQYLYYYLKIHVSWGQQSRNTGLRVSPINCWRESSWDSRFPTFLES